MKRTTKYAALDVHQTTTLASVRAEGGGVMARATLPAEERAIAGWRSSRPRVPTTRSRTSEPCEGIAHR